MLFHVSKCLLAIGVLMAVSSHPANATSFEIQPSESRVRFQVRHHDYSKPVHGRFRELGGEIQYDADAPDRASMEVFIDPASVDTDNHYRDRHLRSSFFETDRFPEILFRLTAIRLDEEVVEGELTVKGVTRVVALSISRLRVSIDAKGVPALRCRAKARINRRDFGVAENAEASSGLGSLLAHIQEGLDAFIEDEVEIEISITARAHGDFRTDEVDDRIL